MPTSAARMLAFGVLAALCVAALGGRAPARNLLRTATPKPDVTGSSDKRSIVGSTDDSEPDSTHQQSTRLVMRVHGIPDKWWSWELGPQDTMDNIVDISLGFVMKQFGLAHVQDEVIKGLQEDRDVIWRPGELDIIWGPDHYGVMPFQKVAWYGGGAPLVTFLHLAGVVQSQAAVDVIAGAFARRPWVPGLPDKDDFRDFLDLQSASPPRHEFESQIQSMFEEENAGPSDKLSTVASTENAGPSDKLSTVASTDPDAPHSPYARLVMRVHGIPDRSWTWELGPEHTMDNILDITTTFVMQQFGLAHVRDEVIKGLQEDHDVAWGPGELHVIWGPGEDEVVPLQKVAWYGGEAPFVRFLQLAGVVQPQGAADNQDDLATDFGDVEPKLEE